MAYEDLFWEIHQEMEKKGLRKEFDAQLKKMKGQEKHKYKETRDNWDYAYHKVLKNQKKTE